MGVPYPGIVSTTLAGIAAKTLVLLELWFYWNCDISLDITLHAVNRILCTCSHPSTCPMVANFMLSTNKFCLVNNTEYQP